MPVLKWVSPDTVDLTPRFNTELAEQLKSKPGRWALVAKSHPNAGNCYTFAKRHGFEVTCRGSLRSGFDIFMRAVA